MKSTLSKAVVLLPILMLAGCMHQRINVRSLSFEGLSYHQIWNAALRAVHDIDFVIYAVDERAGFIGAEGGRQIYQDVPPRLSIFITEDYGRVYVDCKVHQPEQLIDFFGYGRRTVRHFFAALNMNLHRGYDR